MSISRELQCQMLAPKDQGRLPECLSQRAIYDAYRFCRYYGQLAIAQRVNFVSKVM